MKKAEEYGTFEEKEQMTKVALYYATLGYIVDNDNIEDALKKIDKTMIPEDTVLNYKDLASKVCYYADKIALATKMLAMNKLYKEKRIDDILALIQYIKKETDKLEAIVIINK